MVGIGGCVVVGGVVYYCCIDCVVGVGGIVW